MPPTDDRIPVLYLAPWLDIGGSDKGTLDWFRFLDRDRYRPSLIMTQPSPNRRVKDVVPYADEVWDLPDLMPGNEFARFIVTFIVSRQIQVLHVMNSRLGFELLPDVAGLPDRPRVVLQLHVEESDRSGYVRYVSTRYGNLVDAFSVSSHALSEQLERYAVPRAKRRTIYTGVDAEHEFSPARVKPVDGLDRERIHILFPARLVAQKDPLLMLDVAARLRAEGMDFCIHVLGDGLMMDAVSDRIAAAGLERSVILHGERIDIAPWYAACDVVLLTSQFEGVPYVAYEAMAMATPLVAPDLPGLRELVTPESGILVSPRARIEGYVEALTSLAHDASLRRSIGRSSRARALSEFPLERMAAEHGALYEELLAAAISSENRSPPANPDQVARERIRLRNRRPGGSPLVSVIVPCFNDGHYLSGCLESIAGQGYDHIETIVVDNASTDPDTLDAFEKLADSEVKLLRMSVNRGPSPARNAAIEVATGRYVLPVDADNMLLPNAISDLVEQLGSAGEQVGFIYPNYQFFGNRQDYFEPPSYNLHALLSANYCDTSSLIDREIFDWGFRYPEEIVLGYEDWDLVLSLAEHGIYGEPARNRTLLYRKHGFTRSDLVAASTPFLRTAELRHPSLYGCRPQLKAQWNPAITLIVLDPLQANHGDALSNLVGAARAQSCPDFEVLICSDSEAWPTPSGRQVRRIPRALAASRAEVLAQGMQMARGRYVLASYGSAAGVLVDRSVIEKALRVLKTNPLIDALALAEGADGLGTFRLLDGTTAEDAQLSALLWTADGRGALPTALPVSGQHPLEALARWLSAHATVQWRHLPRRDRRAVVAADDGPQARLGSPRFARARDARQRSEETMVPDFPPAAAPRLRWPTVWMPPQARILSRHRHHSSGRYVFTNDRNPPPGCRFDYDLGSVRGLPFPGTVSLQTRQEGPKIGFVIDQPAELEAPELLGFVEQAPLPLFDPLQIARHRETGQRVLISGANDPLLGLVDEVTFIGFIEPYPIHPRQPPHAEVDYGLVGLIRSIDLQARRHRYGAGRKLAGELVGELGALFSEPTGDCDPLHIDGDGHVLMPGAAKSAQRPSLLVALRWAGAPLTWRQFGALGPKARACVRRSLDASRSLTSAPSPTGAACSPPAGYVLRSPTPRTIPLFAAVHPVTGDQLLCTDEREPGALGYRPPVRLGHLIAQGPLTGQIGIDRRGIPWASRFGQAGVGR